MGMLFAYRAATVLLGPFIMLYLMRRRGMGKEDHERFGERFGRPEHRRPPGRLVWLHAASVGEATSVLALIDRLRAERPHLNVLVTTGTIASAGLLAQRLPKDGAWHQYVPVDRPSYVRRFLRHWRPDLAIWVESELWPNLVVETKASGIPMVLLNARMSERSFKSWQRWPKMIATILKSFDICLAQDEVQANRLRELGAVTTETVGDLKGSAAPLVADRATLEELSALIGDRPRWLAASTHPGEEAAAGAAHRALAESFPGLLTIIAPRHPRRADEIVATLTALGLTVARRSREEPIEATTAVYLADTMGEMGLFFRLASIVFVGGSLTPMGGHNPLEPASLSCAILHGPDMANCAAVAAELRAAGAALQVGDAVELAAAVRRLLDERLERERMGRAGGEIAGRHRAVLSTILARLDPLLDRLTVTGAHARP